MHCVSLVQSLPLLHLLGLHLLTPFRTRGPRLSYTGLVILSRVEFQDRRTAVPAGNIPEDATATASCRSRTNIDIFLSCRREKSDLQGVYQVEPIPTVFGHPPGNVKGEQVPKMNLIFMEQSKGELAGLRRHLVQNGKARADRRHPSRARGNLAPRSHRTTLDTAGKPGAQVTTDNTRHCWEIWRLEAAAAFRPTS